MSPYASFFRRAMALLLDGLVLGVIAFAFSRILPFVGPLVAWFLYFPVLESSELRATLGKYWMGIQVVGVDQERLSLKRALARNIVKLFSSALMCLGYLLSLFTAKHQTFHDLVVETVVIYGRSTDDVPKAWMDSVRSLWS